MILRVGSAYGAGQISRALYSTSIRSLDIDSNRFLTLECPFEIDSVLRYCGQGAGNEGHQNAAVCTTALLSRDIWFGFVTYTPSLLNVEEMNPYVITQATLSAASLSLPV